MDDRDFHRILACFNLSRKGYRKVRKGVKKRLTRHMRRRGCKGVDEYLGFLARSPQDTQECRMHLTVSISRFFRDRSLWETLEDTLMPRLLTGHKGRFCVWSCGCARGEEVYSFKILWDRLRETYENLPQLVLWGTDMNPDYLEMARKGIYGVSSLKELTPEIIARYFDKLPGKQIYAVKPALREGIRFRRHDVTKDPPPARRFELIFLRNNLLTYNRQPEKQRCLEEIVRMLSHGGALITGSHEKLPEGFGVVRAVPDHPWIFSKSGHV